jgi:hypothetical protein
MSTITYTQATRERRTRIYYALAVPSTAAKRTKAGRWLAANSNEGVRKAITAFNAANLADSLQGGNNQYATIEDYLASLDWPALRAGLLDTIRIADLTAGGKVVIFSVDENTIVPNPSWATITKIGDDSIAAIAWIDKNIVEDV